jgi:C4-dicarboxylate-specific signal transduction histidine kinase
MARLPRFGLRAQIVLALLLVFMLSYALLGAAALGLTRSASEREHARATQAALEALVSVLHREPNEPRAQRGRLEVAVAAFCERIDARAFRVVHADGRVLQVGDAPIKGSMSKGVTLVLESGTRITVWPSTEAARTYAPLANLLVFYVLLTGLAVLVLAYLALTHLIVRPLDRLTHGSELLAQGSLDARVPERGAAEVAHLAATFNVMAEQLKNERQTLVARLAELEATTTELQKTQSQLIHGEKLASVGRLAAGVAHEIGNPLAAILGLVELLQGAELEPSERAEFLARIQRETERIHGIIRDLLDFARRDAESEAAQTADLAHAVQDALDLVRPQKESREVAFEVAIADDARSVFGPSQRITQVVLNLLLNAVDALGGRGSIAVSAARELDASGQAFSVLRVSDDGPGIAPEMLDKLFEPFATTKAPGKGTGLGLAVCHTLVDAIGGRIEAANRPQGGAAFSVWLRAA